MMQSTAHQDVNVEEADLGGPDAKKRIKRPTLGGVTWPTASGN
jgi:hypothetical protein